MQKTLHEFRDPIHGFIHVDTDERRVIDSSPVQRLRQIHQLATSYFLTQWLPGGKFSIDLSDHLRMTDTQVLAAMAEAARDNSRPGHDPARRIMQRQHFREVWKRNPADSRAVPNAGQVIYDAAVEEFGAESIRRDWLAPEAPYIEFPVWFRDENRVTSAQELSDVLPRLPAAGFDYVFVAPEKLSDAKKWLQVNREAVLKRAAEEKTEKEQELSG